MLLGKLGKFEEAQDIYGDILQGYDQALGEDHPSTLDIVSLLAMLHKDNGDLDGARSLYERALRGTNPI